ncbi:ABC transporter ATP-binding protein [Vibrio crassostreae]|uniref:ATP-binding cassette domain-containing protein n=1 Tax=Vibrio crassostreae TaxID=246167 RepID=UPI001B304DA8|nr:AAA family ATPase [Vibrio crassostreae]
MLKQITLKPTHPLYYRIEECVGVEGLTVDFDRGVNVLCGANGSGKSTLFNALKSFLLEGGSQECFEYKIFKPASPEHQYVYFLDMRTLTAKEMLKDAERNPNPNPSLDMGSEILRMWKSNGEQMHKIVDDIAELGKGARLIFLDEPELSLDFEAMNKLVSTLNEIANNGCTVVAISHHPLLVLNKTFNVVGLDGTNDYALGMKDAILNVIQ